ncbi:MAG TPA: helix-turn-helix domain-containing protein [Candidatus Nanoarchaeia archaeon]|nr:helix-turn-helix domain-containing protein [Candidatus Nanoarchaeia archaeon]
MHRELKEFGLTDNEITIYLALLELGTANPAEVTQKTGFSRAYVYDALERMQEKEMVSSVLKNNKKHYTATEPKRLGELAGQRLEKIRRLIPHLESLQKVSREEIRVELHRGVYVYKTLLQDIISTLKHNGEVLIFGIDDETLSQLDKHYLTNLKIYFSKLQKLSIKEKVIAKRSAKIIKESKTTAYKFLPGKVIGSTAFEVYGDKVAIFLWGSPNHLILIQSKEVASSYRNQFNILWKNAVSK